MSPRDSLVPARFLALTAHLVLLGAVGGATDPHVRASLPPDFTAEEYARAERWLWGSLGGSLCLLLLEFGGFLSGGSMFRPGQSLFSLGAHVGGALGLTLEILGGGAHFWLLFGLFSVPPALTELLLLVSDLGCRKRGF